MTEKLPYDVEHIHERLASLCVEMKQLDMQLEKEMREAAKRDGTDNGEWHRVTGEKQLEIIELQCELRNEQKELFKAVEEIRKAQEQDAAPLASYATNSLFIDHSLAAKTIHGMVDIAHGQSFYELTPKSGKSQERYKLTASEDACTELFISDGANTEQVLAVLETVHRLKTDERAKGFIYKGRIWFTVNTILREMSRTAGGAIKDPRKSKAARRLVDDVLRAASGAQIVGTTAAGEVMNIDYLVAAIKRPSITYKGETYTDVWGFQADAITLADYAGNQGGYYPLLDMPTPLTIEEAGVSRYVSDKLHQIRGKLYTRTGRKSRQRSFTITLSWEELFNRFSPIGEMNSRQKKKLVETLQTLLRVNARMEAEGQIFQDRPIYLKAESTRGARGEWEKLVIKGSSSFLAYKDANIKLI